MIVTSCKSDKVERFYKVLKFRPIKKVEEPVVLPIGTEVSAKYRGAFCEAKVKSLVRNVTLKVTMKDGGQSFTVKDRDVKGPLHTGAVVELRHPESAMFVEAMISHWKDCTMYTVVFDDGDENTLRRTQLCLKGEKHFVQSETLDQLPLTHPEHFGTPVMKAIKGYKRRCGSESEDSDDESLDLSPKKRVYRGRQMQDMIGKIVCMVVEERKRASNMPVLVVLPSASELDLKTREHLLVRSFKDNRFHTVPRKDTKDFRRELAIKNEEKTLKSAYERALAFMDNGELPLSWDKDELLGSDSEDDAEISDSSDDEPSEEKDCFVAQLYKFMDDRGTPINKAPTVGNRDLSLYKLFRVVQNLGGYNRVTNQMRWKTVYVKMNLPPYGNAANQIKAAYKKYLHAFEDFYRKLGNTMGNNINRPSRSRHKPSRNILSVRNKDAPRSPKPERKPSPAPKATTSKDEDNVEPKTVRSKVKDDSPAPMKKYSSDGQFVAIKTTTSKPISDSPGTRLGPGSSGLTPRKQRIKIPSAKMKESPLAAKRFTRDDMNTIAKIRSSKLKVVGLGKLKETADAAKAFPAKKEFTSVKVTSRLDIGDKKVRKALRMDDEPKLKKLRTDLLTSGRLKKMEPKSEAVIGKAKVIMSRTDGEDGKRAKQLEKGKIVEKLKEVKEVKVEGATVRVKKQQKPDVVSPPSEERGKREGRQKKSGVVGSPDAARPEAARPRRPNKIELTETKIKREDVVDRKQTGTPTSEKKETIRSETDKSDVKRRKAVASTEGAESLYTIGSKLRVKYGKGSNQKIYEAKIIEATLENGRPHYLVHYAGWNNRYNEWIQNERIICLLEVGDPNYVPPKIPLLPMKKSPKGIKPFIKKSLKTPSSSDQQSKYGKPMTGDSSSSSSSISRPTRSHSVDLSNTPTLPVKRRKRRLSGLTDQSSDVPSHESETESDASAVERSSRHPALDDAHQTDTAQKLTEKSPWGRERVKTKAEVKSRPDLPVNLDYESSLPDSIDPDDLGPPTIDKPEEMPKMIELRGGDDQSEPSIEDSVESDHSLNEEAPQLERSVCGDYKKEDDLSPLNEQEEEEEEEEDNDGYPMHEDNQEDVQEEMDVKDEPEDEEDKVEPVSDVEEEIPDIKEVSPVKLMSPAKLTAHVKHSPSRQVKVTDTMDKVIDKNVSDVDVKEENVEPSGAIKAESKTEGRTESKTEGRAESITESTIESKEESKVESKTESKTESKGVEDEEIQKDDEEVKPSESTSKEVVTKGKKEKKEKTKTVRGKAEKSSKVKVKAEKVIENEPEKKVEVKIEKKVEEKADPEETAEKPEMEKVSESQKKSRKRKVAEPVEAVCKPEPEEVIEADHVEEGVDDTAPQTSDMESTAAQKEQLSNAATSGLLLLAAHSANSAAEQVPTYRNKPLDNLIEASMMLPDDSSSADGDKEDWDGSEDHVMTPVHRRNLDFTPPDSPLMDHLRLPPHPDDDVSSQMSDDIDRDRDDDVTSSASQASQSPPRRLSEHCDMPVSGQNEAEAGSIGSSGNAPGSESDRSDHTRATKEKTTAVEQPPPKRRKRRQRRTESQKHKRHSSAHMSDSDDEHTTYHSPAKKSSTISHSLTQAELAQRLQNRPPKFNFHLEEGESLDADGKIDFLMTKMQEIRKLFLSRKAEVLSIDRRRKRARRKERDTIAYSASPSIVGEENVSNTAACS